MIRPPRLPFARWSIALAALAIAADGPTLAQPAAPNEMKAAITYKIVQFIRFPRHDPATPLDLCVARDEPMASALNMLRGQPVAATVLRVRAVSGTPASYRTCHIAYLGLAQRSLAGTSGLSGTLTIGEGEDFTSQGGMVGLVGSGRQIRFHVNYGAAERSGIRISSKLLRLAVRVIE